MRFLAVLVVMLAVIGAVPAAAPPPTRLPSAKEAILNQFREKVRAMHFQGDQEAHERLMKKWAELEKQKRKLNRPKPHGIWG